METPKTEKIKIEIDDLEHALALLANAADICIERLDTTADTEFEYKTALKYISCARGELGSELKTLNDMLCDEIAKEKNGN